MKISRRTSLSLLPLALVAPDALAAANSREAEAVKFENAWADAWVRGDVPAMERMLTDDFVEVDPQGAILTRSAHLDGFKSGKLKFQSLKLSEIQVRLYGEVAIVTGIGDDKSTFNGQDISGKYRFTDVLVGRRGQWKAATTQSTKIVG